MDDDLLHRQVHGYRTHRLTHRQTDEERQYPEAKTGLGLKWHIILLYPLYNVTLYLVREILWQIKSFWPQIK